MENNEVVKQESGISIIKHANNTYSSFKPKTTEERKKLFNALEKCDVVINDIVGHNIKVKDIIINEYPRKDKETGEEISNGHRTILLDDQGKSYVTASNYFFIGIAKLIGQFGEPHEWEDPIEIKIMKKPLKNGNQALGFELV